MNYKILLVDDEVDFLDVISEFLEFQGYETGTALNGDDALKILEKKKYDLIISDINMPGMKGYELLKKVSELYPQMKRVLITAYDVRDYIRFAKDFDIGNIMVKTTPFNFNEITIFISNILSGNIFGISRYVTGEPQQNRIKSNKDLEIVNQQVLNFSADQNICQNSARDWEKYLLMHFSMVPEMNLEVKNTCGTWMLKLKRIKP